MNKVYIFGKCKYIVVKTVKCYKKRLHSTFFCILHSLEEIRYLCHSLPLWFLRDKKESHFLRSTRGRIQRFARVAERQFPHADAHICHSSRIEVRSNRVCGSKVIRLIFAASNSLIIFYYFLFHESGFIYRKPIVNERFILYVLLLWTFYSRYKMTKRDLLTHIVLRVL